MSTAGAKRANVTWEARTNRTTSTEPAGRSESLKNASRVKAAKRTGQRDGMHGIARIAMRIAHAANRRHTSPSHGQNRWSTRHLPDSVDAAGGVQSRHPTGRALAYRGICASTAQMADCQSFRNTCDAGISCASRRTGCGTFPANTAGIVGIARIKRCD